MNNYEIFNLSDLKKAAKEIDSLYNNPSNLNKDSLINIILHIQSKEIIQPSNFNNLDVNIAHACYYNMIYTIKMILAKIYMTVNENLTITLSYHLIQDFILKKNKQIKTKVIKIITLIKELQQELNINSNKLFLQINNSNNLQPFKEILFFLENKSLQGLKISGGLILQGAFVCNIILAMDENYLQQLLNTNVLDKLHNIEIEFIDINHNESLFNRNYAHNQANLMLEKRKSQLFKLFSIIKKLINKYHNITNFEICFSKYNLNTSNKFEKILNLLPTEYMCVQPVYTNLVQNSVLINIKNKLEKYLSKIQKLDNSLENLNQICIQQNIAQDEFLIYKLQQNISEIIKIKQDIIQKFIKYSNILNKKDESAVFYYLPKFYQYKKEFQTIYKYLELVNQSSTSFEVLNNLNFFLHLNNYATHLESFSSDTIKPTENKTLIENQALIINQALTENQLLMNNHALIGNQLLINNHALTENQNFTENQALFFSRLKQYSSIPTSSNHFSNLTNGGFSPNSNHRIENSILEPKF